MEDCELLKEALARYLELEMDINPCTGYIKTIIKNIGADWQLY